MCIPNRFYPTTETSIGEHVRDRRWYVVKTKPRVEHQSADLLHHRGLPVYLPLLKRRRLQPLFPGYFFLKIDCQSDDYIRCRSAPGVSYILSTDGVPIPVGDDLVEAIRTRVDRENSLRPAERFRPGDRVVMVDGPLRHIEAIFDRALGPQGRCIVLMQMLGSLTRVQVDADDLAKRGT